MTTWLSLFGLLGVYRKHFGKPSRTIRTLAVPRSWIYLAHLPDRRPDPDRLYDAPIPTFAKFALTWTLTLSLGLSSYLILTEDPNSAAS